MILIAILTQTIMPRPVEGVLKVIMLILLLFFQLSLQKFAFFRSIYERSAHKCLTVLTATLNKGRN